MLWQRILIGIIGGAFFSGMFSVLAHQSLVQIFGKHVGSRKDGRYTEHHYSVNQKARRRIRWGTLIFFLLGTVLCFACLWSTMLTPENFSKFFPGL